MGKITDADYRLPRVEALASFGLMDTGTTEPMGIWGVDTETGERGQYVVKFIGSSRMSVKSSCRELLGCWIAKQLDIDVVEPVIVNISEDFVTTFSGQKGYQSALKSIGLNFGSVYEVGYVNFPNTYFSLNSSLLEQAKMIFMFDMLIGNADRGAAKPNVMCDGKKFLIFDHELAFSFADILPFLRNKTPWILGETEKEMYTTHYFYQFLRRQQIDFTSFTDKLVILNNDFWNKALSLIPTAWKSKELSDIKSHFDLVIKNRHSFSEQLIKILAV